MSHCNRGFASLFSSVHHRWQLQSESPCSFSLSSSLFFSSLSSSPRPVAPVPGPWKRRIRRRKRNQPLLSLYQLSPNQGSIGSPCRWWQEPGSSCSRTLTTTTTTFPSVPVVRIHGNEDENDYDTNDITEHQHSLAQEILQHYVPRQMPVLLQHYHSHSRAVRYWKDLDYVVQRVYDNQALTSPDYEHSATSKVYCTVEQGAYNNVHLERLTIPFESYVDYLKLFQEEQQQQHHQQQKPSSSSSPKQDESAPPILYLAQNDLHSFGSSLASDVILPPFCYTPTANMGHGHLYQTMLWMGPDGAFTPLHYDPLDNLLLQMVGTKRVTLFPRTVPAAALSAGREFDQQYNTSALSNVLLLLSEDNDHNVETSHPALLQARDQLVTAVLEPGDALYIPAQWWHQVESLTMSISVNVWWR